MTLPLPRLDDRTWQDLRDEGVALIPRYAPTWTDHNLTDPGITLIELLAQHTEQELFRLDQIGEPHHQAFVRLLGAAQQPTGPRPATTLLTFEPTLHRLTTPQEAHLRTGEYLVPRQPPTRPAMARPRHVYGVGESIPSPQLRQGGEPDEPLLIPDATEDRPQLPEFGFRASHDLTLTGMLLIAVHSFDGIRFNDITDLLMRLQPASVWGDDPVDPQGQPEETQPALYLAFNWHQFDPALLFQEPADNALTLWCVPEGFGPATLGEPVEHFEPREHPTAPAPAEKPVPVREHGFRAYNPLRPPGRLRDGTVRWEYFHDRHWHPIPTAAPFRDETRGFTQPGRVVIPAAILSAVYSAGRTGRGGGVQGVRAADFYLRCRLCQGRPDAPPRLCALLADAVLVEQWDQSTTSFRLLWDTTHPPTVVPPEYLRALHVSEEIEADVSDAANDLAQRGWGAAVAAWGNWPLWAAFRAARHRGVEPPVVARQAPRLQAVVLGIGNGAPNQRFNLPCPPDNTRFQPDFPENEEDEPPIQIMTDTLRVWTLEPSWGWLPAPDAAPQPWEALEWQQVPNLLLGTRKEANFRYQPTPNGTRHTAPGRIEFGDGENGRVPAAGAIILASYSWTLAEAANFSGGFLWARASERDRAHPDRVTAYPTVRFRNPLPTAGGGSGETLSHALRRLAADFEAPARLIALAEQARAVTLDGLELAGIQPPTMAVNLLDFECLARKVPGTVVARARAWAEVDPRFPGVVAPGAVTVVVVPQLPEQRPEPTAGLLLCIRSYLLERRPLACRVYVIGPDYAPLRVRVTVHTTPGMETAVRRAVTAAVAKFLHPLKGGTHGTGWPFGRDVYPGELLGMLATVSGVKHVTSLQLAAGAGPWQEAPVRVPAQALVDVIDLDLTVRGDA